MNFIVESFKLSTQLLFLLLISSSICRSEEPAKKSDDSPVLERLSEEAAKALHQVYAYDATIPLEPRTVEKIEKNGTVREKVVFRSTQGFLVPGYFEFPAEAKGPFPCVLLAHGWSGSKDHFWRDGGYISGGEVRQALLAAGYVVLAIDAQIHGDRISQNDFAVVNHYADPSLPKPARKGYFTQQEIYMQTTRDYRRAIDYLETRPDVIASRIGIVGYSMGGANTFQLTGVEPRVKVSVAVCTPADKSKFSSIAPQNFTRNLGDRPFLMIMGDTDEMCSPALARQVYSMLETTKKDLIFIEGGHKLPPNWVPHAIDWIRKHL